jgi:hypothetical protein
MSEDACILKDRNNTEITEGCSVRHYPADKVRKIIKRLNGQLAFTVTDAHGDVHCIPVKGREKTMEVV